MKEISKSILLASFLGFIFILGSPGFLVSAQENGTSVGDRVPVEDEELADTQVIAQLGEIDVIDSKFISGEEKAEIVVKNTGSTSKTVVFQDMNSFSDSGNVKPDFNIFEIPPGDTFRVVTSAQRDVTDQSVGVITGSLSNLKMVRLTNDGVSNVIPKSPNRIDLVQAFTSTGLSASLMIGIVAYSRLKREKSILRNTFNSTHSVRPKLRKLDKEDDQSIEDIGRERRGYLPRASENRIVHIVNLAVANFFRILPYLFLAGGVGFLSIGMNWISIPGLGWQVGESVRMLIVTVGFGIIVGYISSSKVVNIFLDVPKEYIQTVNAAAEDGSEVVDVWEGSPILMADLTMKEGTPRLERVHGHTVYIVRDFDPYTMTAEGAWQGELDDVDLMTTRKAIKANRGNIRKWANIGKTLYANLDTIVENVANEFWRSKSDDLLEKSTTEPDIVRNEVVDEVEELTDSIQTPDEPSIDSLLQESGVDTEDLDGSTGGDED